MTDPVAEGTRRVAEARDLAERLRASVAEVVVGQEQAVEEVLIALLSGGHALLVGVPGVAKTLLVKTVAGLLGLSSRRIQFTPDLMPADVTGTEFLDRGPHDVGGPLALRFAPGPLFANVVLADEINRASPKTQAALLEAMEERQVTAGGERHPLPDPFVVLATRNPIEQDGTFPLPEAQRDRFLLEVVLDYPDAAEEEAIIRLTTGAEPAPPGPVVEAATLRSVMRSVREVVIGDDLVAASVGLVRATRPERTRRGGPGATAVDRHVDWGAGPRAGRALVLAAKARALLGGRPEVCREDLRRVALPVLRHRLVLNYAADSEGVTAERLIADLVATHLADAPVPRALRRFLG